MTGKRADPADPAVYPGVSPTNRQTLLGSCLTPASGCTSWNRVALSVTGAGSFDP
jgi:hypothetical protein